MAKLIKRYEIVAVDGWENLLRTIDSYGRSAWVIGSGHLLHSNDGGVTWVEKFEQSPLKLAFGMSYRVKVGRLGPNILFFPDSKSAIIFQSLDDGKNWTQSVVSDECVEAEMAVLNEYLWCIVKGKSELAILHHKSHPTTAWERIPIKMEGVPKDIAFINSMSGWILGVQKSESWSLSPNLTDLSVILRTNDGGSTWHEVSRVPLAATRLIVVDLDQILLLSDSGIILKSEDRGESWREIANLPGFYLSDADSKAQYTVAVGSKDLIESASDAALLISSDSGGTWNRIGTCVAEDFLGVRIIDWSTAIVVTSRSIYTYEMASPDS